MIIIDFIDMTLERHKRTLERKLIESLKGERARITEAASQFEAVSPGR